MIDASEIHRLRMGYGVIGAGEVASDYANARLAQEGFLAGRIPRPMRTTHSWMALVEALDPWRVLFAHDVASWERGPGVSADGLSPRHALDEGISGLRRLHAALELGHRDSGAGKFLGLEHDPGFLKRMPIRTRVRHHEQQLVDGTITLLRLLATKQRLEIPEPGLGSHADPHAIDCQEHVPGSLIAVHRDRCLDCPSDPRMDARQEAANQRHMRGVTEASSCGEAPDAEVEADDAGDARRHDDGRPAAATRLDAAERGLRKASQSAHVALRQAACQTRFAKLLGQLPRQPFPASGSQLEEPLSIRHAGMVHEGPYGPVTRRGATRPKSR